MSPWLDYTQEEKHLARFLNLFALIFAGFSLFMLIGPYLLRDALLFIAPPFFVTNTIAGLGLLAFLAWLAAGDVRRFRAMIYVLAGGLLIGAAACVILYLWPDAAMQQAPLLLGFAVCAVMALALAGLMSRAKTPQAPWLPWLPDKPLSQWEQISRVVFGLFSLLALGAAAASVLLPYLNISLLAEFLVNPFMIVGSTIKIGVLGLCSALIARDVRRYTHHTQMITALVIGNAASFVAIILVSLFGLERFGDYALIAGDTIFTREQMMIGALLLDIVVIGGFLFLNFRINRVLLDHTGFFNSTQFRALEAIAETLVAGGEAELVPPHEIVLRTDSYLKAFRSDRLSLAKLAVIGLQLAPLTWLKPPVTYMHPAARAAFIDQRFKREIITPSAIYRALDSVVYFINTKLLRLRGRSAEEASAALSFTGLLEAMLRFNMQLVYLGYYGNPEVWPKRDDGRGIGYVPFSQRTKDFDAIPLRSHPPLDVITPQKLERQGVDTISDADVVIIGSGAAGAILAEQLADQGRRVLLLEKGLYVHPDDFKEDEIEMISHLYSDGALQISQALRFTILQGSCVGGTTVVNNAVCFDTPRRVIDHWNSRGAGQAIDPDRYYAAQQAVRQRLRIKPIKAGTRQPLLGGVLNHGDEVIAQGVERYFQKHPAGYKFDVIEANIADCLGCGYCNIGCKYGRKLSMLDEVLPAAQKKHGAENFRIISEANVVQLEENGGKVTRVVAEIQGKRKLYIDHPKTVIVSGGTIHSSWLLMQSKLGRNLPIGQGLSFNMGSPLHGLFDRPMNSFDGLQIAHYLTLDDHPGFVYETWYNPPVAEALAMPGWLDTHFHNMENYNRMAAVGVLIGTEANAHIVPALITGGPDVVFQPTDKDLKMLVDALVILGEIFFEAGALEVYASTRTYQSYRSGAAVYSAQAEIDRLRDLVQRDQDILLGTGHPQGGNAIGTSSTNSVIGPDFKVFGYDNLYVCDASVFPTSTTVNPQLTVMTLAHYAAQLIE